jgi:hypothetical protein
VRDEPAATYARASDEHGRLGDKIRLVPGHWDPSVSPYD